MIHALAQCIIFDATPQILTINAATSSASMESMGSRLRTSICPRAPGASGRHRAGSVGPKITTPDAPAAAARCDTPESTPTKADATRAIAATVGKSRCFRTADAGLAKDRFHRHFGGAQNDRDARAIRDSAFVFFIRPLLTLRVIPSEAEGPRIFFSALRVKFPRPVRDGMKVRVRKSRAIRLRQFRRERREFVRRPVLAGTSAAGKNHNQIRAAAFRLRNRARCSRQVVRRSVRAADSPAERSRQFQSPASRPPIRGRHRRGETDETRPRHRSPPPIARENASRPRRRTSRCDRNPRRIDVRLD